MRLTRYSDYALRVLLYLGTHGDQLVSIAQIAHAYAISKDHLMKVVNDLARAGYVESVRGRNGGIRLARPTAEINIGSVVRHTEEDFDLVACAQCVISRGCGLTSVFDEALQAFMGTLDRYSLADVIARKGDFRHLLIGAA